MQAPNIDSLKLYACLKGNVLVLDPLILDLQSERVCQLDIKERTNCLKISIHDLQFLFFFYHYDNTFLKKIFL